MHRNNYDLSHLSHTAGHIGRLQTVSVIPVEAGASLTINLDGIARLAPCRKEIVSECQVDLMAFHVPYRIPYGQTWIDMMKQGVDSTTTFTGVAVAAPYRTAPYLGINVTKTTINKALLNSYNRIYYNYFAVPSLQFSPDNPSGLNTDFDWFPTTEVGADNTRRYGRLCARLPHVLNGGNQIDAGGATGWETQSLNDTDATVTAAGSFDIRSLAQAKARFRSEAERAWFEHFYQDIMEGKWGTKVGPDTDPSNLRPEMLMRQTHMLSGVDIDGTDDATMGTFQGKTLDRVGFNMPRKYFDEHGLVFILALFRYPLVHTREQHYLFEGLPGYKELSGEPDIWEHERPTNWTPGDWLNGAVSYTAVATILQPYGQWYRFQNNRVHPNFQDIPGYPFSNFDGTTLTDWYYHSNNEYKDTFQTTQIGQWQLQAKLSVTKQSVIPPVEASIYAGS